MWDKLYRTSERQDWCARSWLADTVGAYLQGLADGGYRNTTLRIYADNLFRYGVFLGQRGIQSLAALPDWIEAFLSKGNQRIECLRNRRSALNGFITYLRNQGLIAACQAPPATAQDELIEQYTRFLREHRGICAEYAKSVRRCCGSFLAYAARKGLHQLRTIKPEVIHRFITHEGTQYHRRTMGDRCSILRGFLRYLHRQGITPADLSPSVVAPRTYQHEGCPRFIRRDQVCAVLESVDRDTPQGRRDYAMLLILATYGVRGIEVIRLRLKDIDWRAELRSRKAGNNTVYPLATRVGEAILAYLQNDRPKSHHPQVFLTLKAPFAAIRYTAQLGYLVRQYMAKAGIQVDRPGTHTFR
ncbi:MAG: site-specific integrase, partial [Planctomycetota bacterium]